MRYIAFARRALLVMLFGCLALQIPTVLHAQRKTPSAEALIKEIKRAQEDDLPRSAIKAAEELSLLGQSQHNLYHILIAQDVLWQNWRRIDHEHQTGLFRTLYGLRGAA